jgi:UDP-glucuronate decarboxylase
MIKRQALESPVNLGNPTEFNMLELSEKILNITKSNSRLVFMPLPSDDPRQRKPDISLAKNELNWAPEISLNAGLGKTIEYFQRILN